VGGVFGREAMPPSHKSGGQRAVPPEAEALFIFRQANFSSPEMKTTINF